VLGRQLRGVAAGVLLAALSALPEEEEALDLFAVLEGKAVAPELRREVCARLAAGVYEVACACGGSHRSAAALVDAACRHATWTEAPLATDIGRYISSLHAENEFAGRMASLLGVPGHEQQLGAALQSRMEVANKRLRVAVARFF
jgi:hypothetical protein